MSILKIPNLAGLQKLKEQAEASAKAARRETLAAYRLIALLLSEMGFDCQADYFERSSVYEDDYKMIANRIDELSEEFDDDNNYND